MKKKYANKKNCGRKKVSDKKAAVVAYIRQSQIEALGGIKKAKEIATNLLLNHISK